MLVLAYAQCCTGSVDEEQDYTRAVAAAVWSVVGGVEAEVCWYLEAWVIGNFEAGWPLTDLVDWDLESPGHFESSGYGRQQQCFLQMTPLLVVAGRSGCNAVQRQPLAVSGSYTAAGKQASVSELVPAFAIAIVGLPNTLNKYTVSQENWESEPFSWQIDSAEQQENWEEGYLAGMPLNTSYVGLVWIVRLAEAAVVDGY